MEDASMQNGKYPWEKEDHPFPYMAKFRNTETYQEPCRKCGSVTCQAYFVDWPRTGDFIVVCKGLDCKHMSYKCTNPDTRKDFCMRMISQSPQRAVFMRCYICQKVTTALINLEHKVLQCLVCTTSTSLSLKDVCIWDTLKTHRRIKKKDWCADVWQWST